MDTVSVWFALALAVVALLLGVALGWSSGSRRPTAEVAALQARLAAEQQTAARREQVMLQADAQARDLVGAEAAQLLERVHTQLEQLRRGQVGADSVLREQAQQMAESSRRVQAEAAALVTALRAPQTRGRWGEMQLERVVEAAGMTEHVDYSTQLSSTVDGVTQRPDLVVHLTGGKQVVVDAKAPVAGYLAALEARDEAAQAAAFAAHARHLRTHVDGLSAKQYWARFTPTPEFVVCFVPADTFLDAALREDPELLEHAFAHDVVLATPSTLVALLRTIAYTWRQDALAADVAQVHRHGRELYQRLTTMTGHLDRLGRSLSGAVSAYNDTVGSIERRVLPVARRFADHGVVPARPDPLPGPALLLDAVPRPLTSPDWSPQAPDRATGTATSDLC